MPYNADRDVQKGSDFLKSKHKNAWFVRTIAALSACLMLCACGKTDNIPTTSSEGESTTSSTTIVETEPVLEVVPLVMDGYEIAACTIVLGNSNDRDQQYAAQLITEAVLRKSAVQLQTRQQAPEHGPAIYIGSEQALDIPIQRTDIYFGNSGNAGTVLIAGNVVASARAFIAEYIDGASDANVTLKKAIAQSPDAVEYPADETGVIGGTSVALVDQKNTSVVVVDLEGGSDASPLWQFQPTEALGYNTEKTAHRLDECRVRYSTVLGKYVILFTSSSGYAAVGEYPSGECIFDVLLPGYGPHSIEYLPNGSVAVACSGNGNTRWASIRFYPADQEGNLTQKAQSIALEGAHGVIWDDDRQLLWALGTKEITAYELVGQGTDTTLREIELYKASLPDGGGHDIAAIYSDSSGDSFLIGGKGVLLFDKKSGSFTEAPGDISIKGVKCVGVLDDGRIIRTAATNVYASHDTDRFTVFAPDGTQISEAIFSDYAFYKARLFDPRYGA